MAKTKGLTSQDLTTWEFLFVKAGSTIITSPVTWLVAGTVFADIYPVWLRYVMQTMALLMVDGLFLINWLRLDRQPVDERGRVIDVPLEQKARFTIVTVALYVALLVLAIQHGEGGAGLMFRLAQGLAVVSSVYNAFAQWLRERLDDAKKSTRKDWRVQRHDQRLSRHEARREREYVSAVRLAQYKSTHDVQLEAVKVNTKVGIERVQNGVHVVDQPVQPLNVPTAQHNGHRATTRTRKPDTPEQWVNAIAQIIAEQPDVSKTSIAEQLDGSRTTVTKYYDEAQEQVQKVY